MDSEDSSGFNSFHNDGSFMESYMKKMQEQKKSEATTNTSTTTLPPAKRLPPLMTRKPLAMKMSKRKKAPTLAKPAISLDSATPDNPVEGSSRKEPPTTEPGIPKPDIPVAKSISLASTTADSVTSDPATNCEQAPGTSTPPVAGKKRRRNRWSDAPPSESLPVVPTPSQHLEMAGVATSLNVTPPLPSGQSGTGGQELTPLQLQQIKEQIEMNKLVAEIRAATESAVQRKKKKDPTQPIFEYDSDEDCEGGTWEHRKRFDEMMSTLGKAKELTEMNQGKHHIGDFLPPQELEKFIERANAIKAGRNPDLSDYKEHKLGDANLGFRMLQKAGWAEGQGLGENQDGITAPINQGKTSFDQAGVGAETPGELAKDDTAFDTYRKRMMLAYRFRPNPLNNPRRPYY